MVNEIWNNSTLSPKIDTISDNHMYALLLIFPNERAFVVEHHIQTNKKRGKNIMVMRCTGAFEVMVPSLVHLQTSTQMSKTK